MSSTSRFCAGHPRLVLSSSQGLWENTACGLGWRTCCKPVGAASGDFRALSAALLRGRGRNAAVERRAGCAQRSRPRPRVAAGRRGPRWFRCPRKAGQCEVVAPHPAFMKQSWSSWEPFRVWERVQSAAECFSAAAPASVRVFSPAVWLLPSSPSPDPGAVFVSHTLVSAVR